MIIIISLNVTCSRHDIDENLRIWLETTNPLLPCGEFGIVLAVRSQALVSSQIYACYVPKIPQGRTHSYYPCHFNRYFPCQNDANRLLICVVEWFFLKENLFFISSYHLHPPYWQIILRFCWQWTPKWQKAKVGHVRHISAFRSFSGFIIYNY
jgi:hypothetical protein